MNWEVRQYQQEAVAACLADFAERKCTSVMPEPTGDSSITEARPRARKASRHDAIASSW